MLPYVSKNTAAGREALASKRKKSLRISDLPSLRQAAAEGELVTLGLSSPLTGVRHIVLESPTDIDAFFDFISRYAA